MIEDNEVIINYLKYRLKQRETSKRRGLAIVFDVTYRCNLACRGCGVDAKRNVNSSYRESSTDEIVLILEKIKDYKEKHPHVPIYIYFGGGEPFMRNDLKEILKVASDFFGSENIALDTNGTVASVDEIIEISEYVNRIGISIDGLEEYHNWWRNPTNESEKWHTIIEKISTLLSKKQEMREKIEVASVVTKKNLDEIPELINLLVNKGVKKFVIHRSILVGRFSNLLDLIPSSEEYLMLLRSVAELHQQFKGNVDIRLHHSLESIYINLFLNVKTYDSSKMGEPDIDSCIGIDPWGNVYFDPWFMTKPWSTLKGGNLLDENTSLEEIFQQGLLAIVKSYTARDVRCLGCRKSCSGGSRIVAAATYIASLGLKTSQVTENHILTGLTQIDPACPLTKE